MAALPDRPLPVAAHRGVVGNAATGGVLAGQRQGQAARLPAMGKVQERRSKGQMGLRCRGCCKRLGLRTNKLSVRLAVWQPRGAAAGVLQRGCVVRRQRLTSLCRCARCSRATQLRWRRPMAP